MAKAKRRKRKVAKKRVVARGKRVKRVKRVKRARRRRAPVMGIVADLTRARNELAAQRDAIDTQVAMLDNALAAMGPTRTVGRPPGVRGRKGRRGARGRRAGSLKDHIARVLSAGRGTMAVKDITASVLRSGYKSKNKTLAKSVGIALTQMPEVAKVRRGLFRMK